VHVFITEGISSSKENKVGKVDKTKLLFFLGLRPPHPPYASPVCRRVWRKGFAI
jgi:hypothetical protein